jgi:hypothetical protein
MQGVHELADLAPRDVVARAIVDRMAATGSDHVYLDARHLGAAFLERRFPSIVRRCRELGFDPATELLPVAPAQHYASGGVRVDLDGRASLPGLYACGEVSCTGVHGANRLASNSLLEGLVFANRIADDIVERLVRGELTATAAARWTSVTGGGDGLAGMPPVRALWGAAPLTDDPAVYRYAVAVAACAVAATVLALRSPLGLLLAGCRDHEARMRASGHSVTRALLGAYVWAAALAGLGGHLLVTAQRYVSPADVGFGTSSLCLLAAVLGGVASPLGALAGTALVVITRDRLASNWPGHGPLLLGALFIASVYLLPRGVAGLHIPLMSRRSPRKADL